MLKVSAAKKRITPEGQFLPCHLCGHAIRTAQSKGVMDELWAEAIVLKINDQTLIWVSHDLIGEDRSKNDEMRKHISEKYNVPVQNITIGFVHTHSAPQYSNEPDMIVFSGTPVAGYMEFVENQIEAAVDQCFTQPFEEVHAFMKNTLVNGYYGNRNGKDKIGDNWITSVTFEKDDGTVVCGFFNMSTHSTILGPQNLFVSADLAGYLNREFQARWGAIVLTMIGAAGDMSNRQYRQGNDYKELKRVGEGIMAQIDANPQHDPLNINELNIETFTYHKITQLDRNKKEAQLKDIENRLANAKTFDEKKVYTSSLSFAKSTLNETTATMDCTCTLFQLGDVFILSIPAELFSCFGLQIKDEMKVKCPIIWGYSNYTVGYLADRAEYGQSFETAASNIPEGMTEEIVELIIKHIHNMQH